ncbi:MAG TPA: hypothetical protein VLW50_28760 [Streptosporangiaceae bacterium]|nr:hypothetical protein [Streptosporangiaceae bacterium]
MDAEDRQATDLGQPAMGTRPGMAAVPKPIAAGPETAAPGRFYRDVTWKGTICAGGMGHGTPAMTGVGHGTARPIQDGRWIVLDCEQDQFLADGTHILTWQLHWVSGWVPKHGEYRAVTADSYGHPDMYRGHIDGTAWSSSPSPRPGPGSALPGTPRLRGSSTGGTRCHWVTGNGSSSRNTR